MSPPHYSSIADREHSRERSIHAKPSAIAAAIYQARDLSRSMKFPPRYKIPSVPIVDTPRPREHPRSKGGDGNAVPRALAEEATTRRKTSSPHRTIAKNNNASIYAISSRHPQPQPPDPPSLQLSLRTSRPQRLQGRIKCHDNERKMGIVTPGRQRNGR